MYEAFEECEGTLTSQTRALKCGVMGAVVWFESKREVSSDQEIADEFAVRVRLVVIQ